MVSLDAPLILLAIATVLRLLGGISLDKWVVQLPARHQIGIRPFAAFCRANDLGNGLVLYPVLGVGAAMVTIAAAVIANSPRLTGTPAWSVDSSAVLAVLHSLVTTRAAPQILRLRDPGTDQAAMAAALDRFAAWHTARAIVQLLNFLTLLWSVIAYASR